jgi:hypothetical protein
MDPSWSLCFKGVPDGVGFAAAVRVGVVAGVAVVAGAASHTAADALSSML